MSARHIPTAEDRELVRTMASYGLPQERIAASIRISVPVLLNNYREELDAAIDKADAKVVGALMKQCLDGNVTAQIFWIKTRLRWREAAAQQDVNVKISHEQWLERLEVYEAENPKLLEGKSN